MLMTTHPLQGLAPEAIELPAQTPAYLRENVAFNRRMRVLEPLELGRIPEYLQSLEYASRFVQPTPTNSPLFTPDPRAPAAAIPAAPPVALAPGGQPIQYAAPSSPARPALDMGALHPMRMWQGWRLVRELLERRISAPAAPKPGQYPPRAAAVDPLIPLVWTARGWIPGNHHAEPEEQARQQALATLTGSLPPQHPAAPLTPQEARARILMGLPKVEGSRSLLRAQPRELERALPPPPATHPDDPLAERLHPEYALHMDQVLQAYLQITREMIRDLRLNHPSKHSPNWGHWSTCGLAWPELARVAWPSIEEVLSTEMALAGWVLENSKRCKTQTAMHQEIAGVFNSSPHESMMVVRVARDVSSLLNQRTREEKEAEAVQQLQRAAEMAVDTSDLVTAVRARAQIEGLTEKRPNVDVNEEDLITLMMKLANRVVEQPAPQVAAPSPARGIEQTTTPSETLPALPMPTNPLLMDEKTRRARWEQ